VELLQFGINLITFGRKELQSNKKIYVYIRD